jgi:SAM-dependent methyltransferase
MTEGTDMSSRGPVTALSGEPYVSAIEAVESNRRARAAFHALVMTQAPQGSTILDFGAGPGIDALHYVRAGFKVEAFDIDAQMCASFRIRCRDYLESGSITLHEGSFTDFLRSRAIGPVDVVTANFAPLSMIDDLRELFARFATLTRPRARLIVSVLNPWSLHDLRYGWWWRHRLEYLRAGEFSLPGPGYRIHRRSVTALRRAAAPDFALARVHRGLPVTGLASLPGMRQLAMMSGGFIFLTFERR